MKLQILMSTYNGEHYLAEQLESIRKQTACGQMDVSILVRDDGSKDNTIKLLEEYQEQGVLSWYTGDNLRPAKSFWHLIKSASDADYYAFADQDDVWFPDKLSRAVAQLQSVSNPDLPTLYAGSVVVTDSELNPIKGTCDLGLNYTDFAHSLIYSTAPGCTMVFNRAARTELLKYDMDTHFELIHDWLAHKIITMKGKMIYDAQPSMYYRQHGNNAIGAQRGFKVYRNRVLRFLRADAPVRSCSAKSILDVYGAELSQNDANYRYLDMVANYRTNRKLKKLFRKEKAFKTGSIRDIYLSILILMGRI